MGATFTKDHPLANQRSNVQELLIFAHQVLRKLSRKTPLSARQIQLQLEAEGIQRDIRSVQRLLKTLAETFEEIDCQKTSRPYSYRWRSDAKPLTVSQVSATEALLLRLSELHLNNVLPANLKQALQGFFLEAEIELASQDKSSRTRGWLEKIAQIPAAHRLIPAHVDELILDAVTNCLFENKKLRFDYKTRAGEIRSYLTIPLALVERGPTIYLVAEIETDSPDARTPRRRVFALHRFLEARATTIYFTPPVDFSLSSFLNDESYMYGSGKHLRITFETTRDAGTHLTESKSSADQTHMETELGFQFTATLPDSLETRTWLSSFGPELRLLKLEPLHSKQFLAQENLS